MTGWGNFNMKMARQRYTNRTVCYCRLLSHQRHYATHLLQGGSSSEEFPAVNLPRGWRWEGEWEVDKTYIQTDAEGELMYLLNTMLPLLFTVDPPGWTYASTFSEFDNQLAKGDSITSKTGLLILVRRRRMARTAKRVFAGVAGQNESASIDFKGEGAEAAKPVEQEAAVYSAIGENDL